MRVQSSPQPIQSSKVGPRRQIRGGKLPRSPEKATEPTKEVAPAAPKATEPIKEVAPAAPKKSGRKGDAGKRKRLSVETEGEVATGAPQLQAPEPEPAPKKARKVYAAEEFQYEQPLHSGRFPKLIKRSREWFAKYHTKVKFEQNDPFPGERNAAKAEAAALVELGQQVAGEEAKRRGGWFKNRM